MLVRVTPLDRPDSLHYLVDRFTVPPIEEGAKGEAMLPGEYTLGPGRYQVDWLMRDRSERVCSSHWVMEARLDDEHRDLPLTLPPDTVDQRPQDIFRGQSPVERVALGQRLHVRLLVNFSPTDPRDSTLKPWDVDAIVSILRSIAREPHIYHFSLVAFNIHEESVIYRAHRVSQIDFPALGEAVSALRLGRIDYRRLEDPHSATRFLTSLLVEQLGPQQPEPDAIIIVGPKLMLDKNIPQQALKEAGRAKCPVFYLNYNSNPRGSPWRDAIGAVLKIYRGLEYSITFPRDLGAALTDMVSRLREPH
ncbi:MAG: acetyltransferase [Acidobacteriota bacterium]